MASITSAFIIGVIVGYFIGNPAAWDKLTKKKPEVTAPRGEEKK